MLQIICEAEEKKKGGKKEKETHLVCKGPGGTNPGAAGQCENNSEGQAGDAAAAAAAGSINRARR